MPILLKFFFGIAAVVVLTHIASSPQAEAILTAAKASVGVIVAERSDVISSGTAFVAAQRLAFTAYHLVAGTSRILLKFPDSPAAEVRVTAIDIPNDLAILAIGELTSPPLPLGDSARVREGDRVVVISSQIEAPGTQKHVATDGLVSVVGTGLLQVQTPGTLQNGGGPVLNLRGEVIGLLLLRRQVRGDQSGVNFVAPISAVKSLLGAALLAASVPSPPASSAATTDQPTVPPASAPTPAGQPPPPASTPPAASPSTASPPSSSVAADQPPPPPSLISSAVATDPFLILPGHSIGSVRLGMHVQDVVALLGPRKNVKQLPTGAVAYAWFEPPQNEGIGVRVTGAGVVDRVWAFNDVKYITKDLLRPGSTEAQIRAALGEPSSEDVDSRAKTKTLRYDALGVWFTIQLDPQYKFYNAVFEIGVMQPK